MHTGISMKRDLKIVKDEHKHKDELYVTTKFMLLY